MTTQQLLSLNIDEIAVQIRLKSEKVLLLNAEIIVLIQERDRAERLKDAIMKGDNNEL